ncbi:hypothetical protein AK812_SmicGene9180 [Symbiodinium microadriaticum]|uniref:Uncharacterized protein n=1 Tax=Symbiodinium microadriaticum TaxID=2951 RepID=A0A1Q9EJ01_SYMMI|nr:hypothetical protein AK812_SmicGene9180 [Symbiodinium microadriaticum]
MMQAYGFKEIQQRLSIRNVSESEKVFTRDNANDDDKDLPPSGNENQLVVSFEWKSYFEEKDIQGRVGKEVRRANQDDEVSEKSEWGEDYGADARDGKA